MRHVLVAAVGFLSFMLWGGVQSAAQPATPAAPAAFAAYPTLTITISDEGYAVDGAVTAGPIHMQVINKTTMVEQAHIQVVRLPAEEDVAAVQSLLASRSGQPDWFNANLVGGPDRAVMGRTVDGVVVVTAGTYLVTDPFSGMSSAFAVEESTATAPLAPADTSVSVTIDMSEFQYTGLPQIVAAGDQVWKITNSGQQPHELAIASIPPGMSVAQVLEAFQLDDDDPIPADLQPFAALVKPTDFLPSAGSQEASPGVTTWISLHFEPGTTYVAFCFVPDTETHIRHADEGMISIFTVE